MNTEQATKLKKIASRTLKIINLIEKGLTPAEIIKKTGANRQLVDYYIKLLK